MIVVADASPLIFLAKMRCLELIRSVLGRDIRLPASVRQELLASGVEPSEADRLSAFLRTCRVETVRRPRRFASGMSRADNDALTLAIRCRADILLCDDRLTRMTAVSEGVRPMGTLGVILRAVRRRAMSPDEGRAVVDTLVARHGLRIGIEVYQAVLRELEDTARGR